MYEKLIEFKKNERKELFCRNFIFNSIMTIILIYHCHKPHRSYLLLVILRYHRHNPIDLIYSLCIGVMCMCGRQRNIVEHVVPRRVSSACLQNINRSVYRSADLLVKMESTLWSARVIGFLYLIDTRLY
jgi:hypothetical protein